MVLISLHQRIVMNLLYYFLQYLTYHYYIKKPQQLILQDWRACVVDFPVLMQHIVDSIKFLEKERMYISKPPVRVVSNIYYICNYGESVPLRS